jgi:hypothetical protein
VAQIEPGAALSRHHHEPEETYYVIQPPTPRPRRTSGLGLRSLRSLRTTPDSVGEPHPCHCHPNRTWGGTFSVATSGTSSVAIDSVRGSRAESDS